MNPPAQAYAIATAAKHTGEDPASFVEENPDTRFRHYALHALLAVYPDADRTAVSTCLMAPGKPSYFHRSSCWHVLGQGPHRQEPIEWWDSGVLDLVVRALEAAKPPPEKVVLRPSMPAPARPTPIVKHIPPPASPPTPRNFPAERVEQVVAERPRREPKVATTVIDEFTGRRRLSARDDTPPQPPANREDDFLRRAVENTAKATPRPED